MKRLEPPTDVVEQVIAAHRAGTGDAVALVRPTGGGSAAASALLRRCLHDIGLATMEMTARDAEAARTRIGSRAVSVVVVLDERARCVAESLAAAIAAAVVTGEGSGPGTCAGESQRPRTRRVHGSVRT